MGPVRGLRMLVTVLYASYLVNVGFLLVLLPWSELWPHLVLMMPARVAAVVDHPAVRGAVSAFGVLHLLLLAAEFVYPQRPMEPRPRDRL